MYTIQFFILLIFAYLIGSINPSILISKLVLGKDIRKLGSGNAGATNAFRHLGKKWGIFILFIDALKGFIATTSLYVLPLNINEEDLLLSQLFLGIFAMLGHIFPLYSKFKGGKGVATMFGVMIGISPLIFVYILLGFLLILIVTHYVSVSSMLSAVFFSIALFVDNADNLSNIVISLIALFSLMVILSHIQNIKNLIDKKERKAYLFKKPSS